VRYMLLIYSDESLDAQATKEDWDAMGAAHGVFGQKYHDQIEGGEALNPTSSATTVRVANGEPLTTDGPFAETKEQLAGYYLVEAKDREEALNIAAKIPGARFGSIEARPIMTFS
jgi:hypothetical protein